jgi:phosphoribosylglycinamide formyltransferase-1
MIRRLAVLISGGGSNLRAIIDSCDNGLLKGIAKVVLVISNNDAAFGLKIAMSKGIKTLYIKKNDDLILKELQLEKVDLVCLAGYMSLISPKIVEAFRGKTLNIHPALLPKFGGAGMFGHHVHEAVIASKETKSGATVHFVDEDYDTGEIILQQAVSVLEGETVKGLAAKVLEVEHEIYAKAIKIVCKKGE